MTRRCASGLCYLLATILLVPAVLHGQANPPAKAEEPAPRIDVSAWLFGSYNVQVDDAAKAANGGSSPNKFDINRVYLTFRGPLGNRVSFRVTTDIKQGGATADYKGWFIRLKYGYLQYDWMKPTKQGTTGLARIGMVHTPIVDHEELFWPRNLVQTGPERAGFFPSADLGAAAQLTLPKKLGEVYGSVLNGTGYENPESNVYKDFGLRVSLTPLGASTNLLKTFAISPWFSLGGNASKFVSAPTTPVTRKLTKSFYGVFVGNRDRRLTFGAEYAQRKDDIESGATPATVVFTPTTGTLYDAFVIIRPLEFHNPNLATNSLGAVLRLDRFRPNKSVSGYQKFLIAGVFWEPTRKTALILDYQTTEPRNGLAGTTAKTWFLHWNLVF
jgi:hypothetical protein